MDQFFKIFSPSFLFDLPPVKSVFYLPLSIAFGVLIVAALVILIFVKGEPRKFLRTLVAPFLTVGTLGLIHLGSRYERLPWLSTRLFLALVIAAFMIWMIVILIWLADYLPTYRKNKFTDEKFNKYLPGKK